MEGEAYGPAVRPDPFGYAQPGKAAGSKSLNYDKSPVLQLFFGPAQKLASLSPARFPAHEAASCLNKGIKLKISIKLVILAHK